LPLNTSAKTGGRPGHRTFKRLGAGRLATGRPAAGHLARRRLAADRVARRRRPSLADTRTHFGVEGLNDAVPSSQKQEGPDGGGRPPHVALKACVHGSCLGDQLVRGHCRQLEHLSEASQADLSRQNAYNSARRGTACVPAVWTAEQPWRQDQCLAWNGPTARLGAITDHRAMAAPRREVATVSGRGRVSLRSGR
jgi:hypothetical protein